MSPLIVFSHLRWNFVFQRPQHLMSRLAADHRVIFIEEPILDANGPARVEARFEAADDGAEVEVLVPFTPVAAPGFDDAQLTVLLPLLEREIARREIVAPLVWLYTPMALPLIASLGPRALIYDCMDELSAFRYAPAQLRQRERALMASADLVLCGGPSLYAAREGLHPNLHCLPSAVDPAHFAPPTARPVGGDAADVGRDGEGEGEGESEGAGEYAGAGEGEADGDPLAARAAELQGDLARPRLGYFGVIDERMDLELVAALADARPDWQIVMVGPVVKIDAASLPRRPNIRWLGMQSYAQLPQLLAGWDLCLMPFALNESTRFISPTKTLEYLAGGKPVVSTAIHDVISLYGGAVRIGRDAAGFIAACDAVLYESPQMHASWQKAAAAVVAAGTWEVAAGRVRGWLAALPAAALPSAPTATVPARTAPDKRGPDPIAPDRTASSPSVPATPSVRRAA